MTKHRKKGVTFDKVKQPKRVPEKDAFIQGDDRPMKVTKTDKKHDAQARVEVAIYEALEGAEQGPGPNDDLRRWMVAHPKEWGELSEELRTAYAPVIEMWKRTQKHEIQSNR